jgi:hypothetical protein
MKERDNLEDLGVDGGDNENGSSRYTMVGWIGLIWCSVCTRKWTFGFHKMWNIFLLFEEL